MIDQSNYIHREEGLDKLTDSDKLLKVYSKIHDIHCPNNEYAEENPEIHYDYTCDFILDLISKSKKKE